MMTSQEFGRCVHPRELPRFLLALLVALPIALLVLAGVFISSGLALAAILLLAFLIWFVVEISYATLLGHWVLVSEDNYPRLYNILREVQEYVGFTKHIDILVYEQKNFIAAFRFLYLARRVIFIPSELLESGVSDDELRWIIGRQIGWMRARRRMGPLRYAIAVVEQLGFMNLLIYPYVRATHYTGDRVGLAVVNGDISTAISAMNKLMVGRELGYSVNPAGVVRQYRRTKGSFFAFLARLFSQQPYTTARYTDLIGYAEQQFPSQAEQFASMNPSFQTAGGAWRLLWATPKRGDGYANAVGVMLFLGSIAVAAGGAAFITTGGYQSMLYALQSGSLFNQPSATSTEEPYATDPAAAAPPPSLGGYWSSEIACSDGYSTSWLPDGERVQFGQSGTVWEVGYCSYAQGYWRRDIGQWSEDGYGSFTINWTQHWDGQSGGSTYNDVVELPVQLSDEGGGLHSCTMRFTRADALNGQRACEYGAE